MFLRHVELISGIRDKDQFTVGPDNLELLTPEIASTTLDFPVYDASSIKQLKAGRSTYRHSGFQLL